MTKAEIPIEIPIEIERKFLIRMPDAALLAAQRGVRIKHIEQTYLAAKDGKNARVRRIEEGRSVSFVKTVKRRISALSAFEEEYEIDEQCYREELKNAAEGKNTIVKTRYCIPFEGHIVEIDVYRFWQDRAILEVELGSEDESFSLPDYVSVIKEVSDDGRYKNTNLARKVPLDEI